MHSNKLSFRPSIKQIDRLEKLNKRYNVSKLLREALDVVLDRIENEGSPNKKKGEVLEGVVIPEAKYARSKCIVNGTLKTADNIVKQLREVARRIDLAIETGYWYVTMDHLEDPVENILREQGYTVKHEYSDITNSYQAIIYPYRVEEH